MVDKIAGAAGSAAVQSSTPQTSFKQTMQKPAGAKSAAPAKVEHPQPVAKAKAAGQVAKAGQTQAVSASSPASRPGGPKLLREVQAAQQKLDALLKMAESGRTFSPAELLAFQAHAYRASQELDLAGKVVEKGTSAVKQTLQTQI